MSNAIPGEEVILKVNDLPNNMSFNLQLGKTAYDNSSTRALNQLDYNRVDEAGNYLIYKLEKRLDRSTKNSYWSYKFRRYSKT